MQTQLTGARLVERMTERERAIAARVESVLPELRAHAEACDFEGEFHRPHLKTLREAGLLGIIVPEAYGGLGGGLRDLSAAVFAMGTACASTALAYFFHCSSASRGLLPLEALEAGLFDRGGRRVSRHRKAGRHQHHRRAVPVLRPARRTGGA